MSKKTPAKMGRPSLWDETLAKEICDQLAEGIPLANICKSDRYPSVSTVLSWLDRDDFCQSYARARQQSADKLADEIVSISDDPKLDPNDKRVRVDARKWVAAKLKPQSYGDRLDMNLSGELKVQSVPDEKLDARLAELIAKTGGKS